MKLTQFSESSPRKLRTTNICNLLSTANYNIRTTPTNYAYPTHLIQYDYRFKSKFIFTTLLTLRVDYCIYFIKQTFTEIM